MYALAADDGVVPVGVCRREHIVNGEPMVALVLPGVCDPPVHRHVREGVSGGGSSNALTGEVDGDRLL